MTRASPKPSTSATCKASGAFLRHIPHTPTQAFSHCDKMAQIVSRSACLNWVSVHALSVHTTLALIGHRLARIKFLRDLSIDRVRTNGKAD